MKMRGSQVCMRDVIGEAGQKRFNKSGRHGRPFERNFMAAVGARKPRSRNPGNDLLAQEFGDSIGS